MNHSACDVPGISWLRFLDLEEACVTVVVGSEEEEIVLEKIVRAIRELRPQTIITFGPDSLHGHEDHIAKSEKKRRSPLEMNCPK